MNAARQAFEDAVSEQGAGLDREQYEQAMGPFGTVAVVADRDGDGEVSFIEFMAAGEDEFRRGQEQARQQMGPMQQGQPGQQGQGEQVQVELVPVWIYRVYYLR